MRVIKGLQREDTPADSVEIAFHQQLEQAVQRQPITIEKLTFLTVFKLHPEWMPRILHTAVDIVKKDESRPSASQQIKPIDAFVSETFSLCHSIQEVIAALANFEVLCWEPPQSSSGCFPALQSFFKSDAADFMKAINQAAGVANPESPLEIGLHLRLSAHGVLEQPAARTYKTNVHQGKVITAANALKGTDNPAFMRELEQMGSAFLKGIFNVQSGVHALVQEEHVEILRDHFFFLTHPGYCGVWVEQAKCMQIYRFACPGNSVTTVQLVHIVEDVRRLPGALWHAVSTQEYQIKDGKLQGVCKGKGIGCFGKLWGLSRRRLYSPVSLESTEDERFVTEAFKGSGICGGRWKCLETGPLASSSPQVDMGFRTAEMSFALAGMAVWYPSMVSKEATILDLKNVKLSGGHSLRVGTISVDAEHGWRAHKSSSWKNAAEKVTVVAAKTSKLWASPVMWG